MVACWDCRTSGGDGAYVHMECPIDCIFGGDSGVFIRMIHLNPEVRALYKDYLVHESMELC